MKILDWLKSLPVFIKDVRMEIKRTSFPTKEEVIDTTLVVIVVCIIFGVFLWLVDQAIFSIIQYFLEKMA
ncbi:MAG: preprotein translocase subunit SecE [Acidobacteriota bacterium]|nr:preprotein translocase subunit SecE [Thermoanaerobaculaceae bacterium]